MIPNMTETVETVKTEDMPPLDEDPEVENEDTERDVVQYESEKSETPNKTCKFTSFNNCSLLYKFP